MENLVFNASLPVAPTLVVAFVVWAIATALEWKRHHRFRTLRLVAVTLATLALLGLVWRPSYYSSSTEEPILLLTNGYSEKTKDSLLQLHDVTVLDISKSDTQQVAQQWEVNHTHVRFVLGQGLPVPLLQAFPHISYAYFPPNKPVGITHWQVKPFTVGNTGWLEGEVHYPDSPTTVYFQSPDGHVDSLILEAGTHRFSFPIRARQAGLFTYQLHLQQGNTTIETGMVPVEVLPVRPLRILFLQQHPTFETRYLKTFLAESGHAVSLRYLVSRNTYRFEFVNAPEQRFQQVRADLLETFDLVLMSQEAAEQLNASEKSALAHAAQNGLGVLVLLTQNQTKPDALATWTDMELKSNKTDTMALRLPGWKDPLTLPSAGWQVLHPQLQSLHNGSSSPLWAGYVPIGMGKIGFQLLTETYPLALGGNQEKYADLWTPVLQGMARLQLTANQVQLSESPPYYPHVNYSLTLITNETHPVIYLDSQRIPLRENEEIDGLWSGSFRTTGTGWHHLTMHDSTLQAFYVHAHGTLKSAAISNQIRANEARHSLTTSTSERVQTLRTVSPIWFYLIFLLAAGFLWLSPKL